MKTLPNMARCGSGPKTGLAIVAAVSLMAASHASAQLSRPGGGLGQPEERQQQQSSGQQGLHPPTPRRPDAPPRWIYYGVMLILGGATIAVGIMPAKRSHQD